MRGENRKEGCGQRVFVETEEKKVRRKLGQQHKDVLIGKAKTTADRER